MVLLSYIIAFFKCSIYGSSVFFTSKLTAAADVLDVLALRFLLSFVVMWLLKSTGVLKIGISIKSIFFTENKNYTKNLLLTALFEPVLYMFFETMGISMTTSITTAVILSLAPIASCITEILLLKEKSTHMQRFFLAVGIIGVVYIAINTDTSSGKDSVAGIMFLLLTIIAGALFMAFSRKSSKNFNCWEITYVSCMLGAIAFNFVNIIRHIFGGTLLTYFNPYFNLDNIIGFLFLGVLSTIVATAMNNFALKRMQLSSMAAFGGISTFVTIIIGVVFCGEKLYTYHIIGFTLIIIRMIGVSYISIKKEKTMKKTA